MPRVKPRESSSTERAVGSGHLVWRRKGGLETPLIGRFYGEGRRLFFAPPLWYDGLVNLCIVGGSAYALLALFWGDGFPLWGGPLGMFFALLVVLAGVWGALSSERMVCDLRSRTYTRKEGHGLKKRITKGSLNDLDALVLTSEVPPIAGPGGLAVIYRLVLYWKHSQEPLLVVERESHLVPPGAPLNFMAEGILKRGAEYSRALGIRYFDNSHFHSPGPVPVL